MLVKVLNYGTNWWARFDSDPNDPHRYTRHAAYYNSTGIQCGNKTRRHWIVPGLIRFNGAGGVNTHLPSRSLGHTFFASRPDFLFGRNPLLFREKMPQSSTPPLHFVV